MRDVFGRASDGGAGRIDAIAITVSSSLLKRQSHISLTIVIDMTLAHETSACVENIDAIFRRMAAVAAL